MPHAQTTRAQTTRLKTRAKISQRALAFALPLLGAASACAGQADDDMTADGGGNGDAGTSGSEPTADLPSEAIECAPDQLDVCPDDTKCTAVVAEDGNSYAYQCVADNGELLPGELCMPSPPTGVDGCPSGYACVPDTNLTPTEGHCLRLCADDPGCLDGMCAARPTSPVPVCADYCDPLLADCPATEACRLLEDRAFGCITPLPSDTGVQGQACDAVTQVGCASGFVCTLSDQVPDCLDADACCTAICPVDAAMTECPEPATCQPLALDDWPLVPENLGFCSL